MRLPKIIAIMTLGLPLVAAAGQAVADTVDADDLVEFSIRKKDEKGPVVQLRTAPQVKIKPARKANGLADPAFPHFFTPRATVFSGAALKLKALPVAGGITPRYAESGAVLQAGAVSFGVGSDYAELPTAASGLFSSDSGAMAMAQRSAKLGVFLGYGGLSLGGAAVESRDGASALKGIEGSLSYLAGNWGASVTFGGYKSTADGERRHYGVDLGASYRVNRAMRLQGGVKLFDAPGGLATNGMDPVNPYASGVYLGTSMSF